MKKEDYVTLTGQLVETNQEASIEETITIVDNLSFIITKTIGAEATTDPFREEEEEEEATTTTTTLVIREEVIITGEEVVLEGIKGEVIISITTTTEERIEEEGEIPAIGNKDELMVHKEGEEEMAKFRLLKGKSLINIIFSVLTRIKT